MAISERVNGNGHSYHFGDIEGVAHKHGHIKITRLNLESKTTMRACSVHFLRKQIKPFVFKHIASAAFRAFGM